ncbi:hypothetical protein MFLAVUS_001432 [Mucor flavus]|uniref:CxC1-like cysteine cluster associated with KDZ transposases domain-containing protein n=1 Tax=Mucor flavus TaxID=439312 RepID=A0ABP9YMF6_9FUNG
MLRSDLLQSLWNYKNTASAVKTFNEKHQAGIANEIIRSIGSSSTQREKRRYTPPSPLLVARVERDPVLFWRSSIATRIKEDAVDNVLGYTNLPDIDKYRISIDSTKSFLRFANMRENGCSDRRAIAPIARLPHSCGIFCKKNIYVHFVHNSQTFEIDFCSCRTMPEQLVEMGMLPASLKNILFAIRFGTLEFMKNFF